MAGPHIVLGEGDRDTAFLTALCEARGITGYEFHEVAGNTNFGSYLSAISAQKTFADCKSILLVSDNDESAGKSFKIIKEQLNEIDFPSPPRALEIARKKGLPSLCVLMLPYPAINGSNSGCLETLLIPAMESAHPIQSACVNQMLTCADVQSWPKKGSRDKAKVRCLISTVWLDDPMHGLKFCFSPAKGIIPLGDAIFNDVALVLTHFKEWSISDVKTWDEWKGTIV